METVQLFITCLIDTFQPNIGKSLLRILQQSGVKVAFPENQTCCGQPAYNAGLRAEAKKTAKHIIRTFENAPGPVIIPSGSCTAMIRHGYPELFANDPVWFPRAVELANRTYELTQYLVDILKITDLGASYPGKITYHPSS